MSKVKLISEPKEYFDMLTSDQIYVTDVSFVSDDVIQIRYENNDDFVEPNTRTNVVIAAFTTAHARLKLYSVLEQLKERVVYYHTDSVIYTSKPGLTKTVKSFGWLSPVIIERKTTLFNASKNISSRHKYYVERINYVTSKRSG